MQYILATKKYDGIKANIKGKLVGKLDVPRINEQGIEKPSEDFKEIRRNVDTSWYRENPIPPIYSGMLVTHCFNLKVAIKYDAWNEFSTHDIDIPVSLQHAEV